jgi:CBS domain-containing protein
MLVKELMRQPYVIEKDISLKEAARIMSSKNIGSLIFASKDKIKGIITERDMLKNFKKNVKVGSVMSKSVITAEPEDNVEDALEEMRQNKVKRLPVVEDDKLVGIVSLTDIAAHIDELEEAFFF